MAWADTVTTPERSHPDELEDVGAPAGYSRYRTHKYLVPEIVFGVGSLSEVGNVLRRTGGKRPLVVTDPGVRAAGWAERALPYLKDSGFEVTIWDGLTSNPKDFEVQQGFERFRESGNDVLVALGGGSCIDAAKGIAILSSNKGRILDYEGVDRVSMPLPPMVMIPTTGGTGADVSQFCVITDTVRHSKVTIGGCALVPDVSITDPYLLTTMPPELSAYTAIDALSHAIEAYVSRGADFLSDSHAISAMKGVTEHLLLSLDRPNDPEAREGVARASLQAGLAFTNALLGATHAISHQIGGFLDAHHGLLNAILLPHVIRFNAVTHPYRYLDVAEALGLAVDRSDPQGAAEEVADMIQELSREVGIVTGLGAVGVQPGDIDQFAENALRDAYIATNPRPLTKDDVRDICMAAM